MNYKLLDTFIFFSILLISNTVYAQITEYRFDEEMFGLHDSTLISRIQILDNNIYINSRDRHDLWVYKSENEETIRIYSNDSATFPSNFTSFNGAVYFTLLCSDGISLFKTENSYRSTKRIHQFETEFFDTTAEIFIYNGNLFATTYDSKIIFMLNEDEEILEEVYDMSVWGNNINNISFFELNNEFLIEGSIENEFFLWKVVEFPFKEIVVIKDENDNPISENRRRLLFKNKLYFSSDSDDDLKTWSYDGTGSNAKLFKYAELSTFSINESFDDSLIVIKMTDDQHGSEPWVFDGTIEGTYLLKDICDDCSSRPDDFQFLNGKVNFSTFETNPRLVQRWETDGTEEGTVIVSEYEGSTVGSVIGDRQYELLSLNENEISLTEYIGNGISEEIVRTNGILVSGATQFSSIDDLFFFFHIATSSDFSTYSNWVSNGTSEVTSQLDELNSGPLRYEFSIGGNTYYSLWTRTPIPHIRIFRVSHDSLEYNTPIIIDTVDDIDSNICDKTTYIEILDYKNGSVYPNPTKSSLIIEFDNFEKRYVKIYNTIGMEVYSNNISEAKQELDLNVLAPDLYVLHIVTREGKTEEIHKFIKN